MGIFAKILSSLPLIPSIVNAVELIHGGAKDGATKKQLALQALGLATGVAASVLPGEALEVNAASELASTVIDGVVSAFNKTGWAQPPTPILPAPFASTVVAARKSRKVS